MIKKFKNILLGEEIILKRKIEDNLSKLSTHSGVRN